MTPDQIADIIDGFDDYWDAALDSLSRPDLCPDPDGHRALHSSHEVTIRSLAEGRPIVVAEGFCGYCGGAAR